MKRSRFLAVVFILAAAIHRLPAPVEEISSPSPAAVSRGNVASSRQNPQKPALTPQPVIQFAGRWCGIASGRINQAVFGQKDFSSNYNIEISSDEKMVSWTSSAWMFARFHAVTQKAGRSLSWTTKRHDAAGQTTIICRLEQTSPGVARYSESSGLVNGAFKGAGYELAGTLTKQ
jgi:hypothetical protein